MCGIVVLNTFRVCVSVSLTACVGLTEKQDWPRHRLECVPIASARSNMHAIPQPVQPRLTTVSPMLFTPQEGESGTLLPLGIQTPLAKQLPDRSRVIIVNCEPN